MAARAKSYARVATHLPSVEVEVLRQIGDTIAAIGRTLETLSTDMKDVQQKVARIEGQDLKASVNQLDGRVDALETERNKVIGAAAFFGWITEHAPWLLAVGAIAAAYWTKH